jgi:hypothetical protein
MDEGVYYHAGMITYTVGAAANWHAMSVTCQCHMSVTCAVQDIRYMAHLCNLRQAKVNLAEFVHVHQSVVQGGK